MLNLAILAISLTLLCPSIAFGQTTFELIMKGKVCSEHKSQQVDCDYKIGTEFWLSISGVGNRDAGITFMKSDFKGKHYGTFGLTHGCVIVKADAANKTANPFNFAFISPRNGKVYSDWQSCQSAE